MLSKDFLDRQHHVLTALQARLNGRPLSVEAPSSGDLADTGSFVSELNDMMSLASNQRQLLRDVNDALRRLDKGSYGVCELSGDPIPQARLEALPWARFTIAVQEQVERDGRYRPQAGGLFDDSAKDAADDDEPEEADQADEEPRRGRRAAKED